MLRLWFRSGSSGRLWRRPGGDDADDRADESLRVAKVFCALSGVEEWGSIHIMKAEKKKSLSFEKNPLAQAILKEGKEIQDRFSAKPIYARTGKGFLKSAGVEEMRAAKDSEK